jgi:pimeloyl-ACP methyl ester carboxylesterase
MSEPAKAPLLFIHGMWSHPMVWDRFVSHFSAAGYQCLAPALPGHDVGPNDPTPPVLAQLTLKDYCDSLVKIARDAPSPPVIIGHSMGGLLAQLTAAQVPHTALVLLSPAPSSSIFSLAPAPLKTLWPILSHWGYWNETTRVPRDQALWGIFNNVPPAEAEQAYAELRADSGRALFQIGMPWLDKAKGSAVDYTRLTQPALVMCGDEDRITPLDVARATARRLPGKVSFRELDGFGHWIIGEEGGPKVIAAMEPFLATL